MIRISQLLLIFAVACGGLLPQTLSGDDYAPGESIAQWLDQQLESKTLSAERCDDLTFVRRVYLDVLGRIPHVSETRDFLKVAEDERRKWLINQLLYPTGERADETVRITADHWARIWRRILLPRSVAQVPSALQVEQWLATQFAEDIPFNQVGRELAVPGSSTGGQALFEAAGNSPQTFVTQITRGLLGVRIDCAQCHDHPFTEWKQGDFWGMAAYFAGGVEGQGNGQITHEGTTYPAKTLWDQQPAAPGKRNPQAFAEWLTADDNPQFASSTVNRVWEQLVGRGLFVDADDLDTATEEQRELLDGLGEQFRENGYALRSLVAGILKSDAYQIAAHPVDRPLKVLNPEQVFYSLERALLLPRGRISEMAARYNGRRTQMLARLSEAIGERPDDYASGVPQALMLMNGPMTTDAVNLERSRLLRAVVDAPYMDDTEKLSTLYMAVLTREPSEQEQLQIKSFLDGKESETERKSAHGEILWALINSPEFVLCR